MNWGSWLVWGFAATVLLTTLLSGSQGLGLTRINLPFILGTMFTPARDKARLVGFGVHLVNGWIFSLVYALGFQAVGTANAGLGALAGLAHALFVLAAAMPMLPGLHPRMASEQQGPTAVRKLEPPGFMALHYGYQTPVSVVLAHLAFGAFFGAMYEVRI